MIHPLVAFIVVCIGIFIWKIFSVLFGDRRRTPRPPGKHGRRQDDKAAS